MERRGRHLQRVLRPPRRAARRALPASCPGRCSAAAHGARRGGRGRAERRPSSGPHALTFVDRRGSVSNERIRAELGWEPARRASRPGWPGFAPGPRRGPRLGPGRSAGASADRMARPCRAAAGRLAALAAALSLGASRRHAPGRPRPGSARPGLPRVREAERQLDDLRRSRSSLTTLVALGVLAALLRAVRGSARRGASRERRTRGTAAVQRRVGVGLGLAALVLFVVGIVFTEQARDVEASESGAEPITIQVDGQQWLWRYEYPDAEDDPRRLLGRHPLQLLRPRDPGRHPDHARGQLDRRDAPLVGPGARPRGRRRPRRRATPSASPPTRSAPTRAARPSSPAPATRRCAPRSTSSSPRSTRPSSRSGPTTSTRRATPSRSEVDAGTAPGVELERRMTPADAAGRRPPRGRHRADPAPPSRLDRARHERRPQERRPDVHRDRRCFFAAIALTELVMMRLQLLRPRQHPHPARRSSTGCSPPTASTALLLFALPLAIGLFSLRRRRCRSAPAASRCRASHHLSYWLYLFGGMTIYAELPLPPLRGRHDRPAAALRRRVPRRPRRRRLARRRRPRPARLRPLRDQHDRHAPLRAGRPGMVWRRRAAVRLGRPSVVSYTLLVDRPDHARGDHDAADRPPLRRRLLRPGRAAARRCSTST